MLRKAIFALAILLAIAAGASAAYFALTVPNDIRSEQLLRDARLALKEGNADAARETLGTIVKDYPRTDAAAAAIFALFQMHENERKELARLEGQVKKLTADRAADRARLGRLETRLAEGEAAAAKAAAAAAAAAKQPVVKKPAAKKPPAKKPVKRRR